MTSQEMMKVNCGKGNHFENIAPLGSNPDWRIVVGEVETVDVNALFTLFGYEQIEFIARQYK